MFRISLNPRRLRKSCGERGSKTLHERKEFTMHIAIFGANGRTGLLLLERCLAAGHTVSALVRKPASFVYAERVRVVEGSVFDRKAVDATLIAPDGTRADAVLSALGANSLGKEDVLERAVPVIVAAMEAAGIRRIVALGSAGALDTALDKQSFLRRAIVENLVYKTALKWPVASQRAQYAALAASSLDWTLPMPGMLVDGPGRGRYRVDGDALPKNGARIARADVADFMMAQLTSGEWSRKGVYLVW